MWIRWFPWRLIIKSLAKKHGFIDPVDIMSFLRRASQPSEVLAPVELLRLAAVLHARGLINSQIIQNNLDWSWPYWVEQQYDPRKISFIPRAFSLTHINLTHRNWTAVGVPGMDVMPIVDPRGLVTPLFDGWSIDSWVIPAKGDALIPSRSAKALQKLEMLDNLSVMTDINDGKNYLHSRVELETTDRGPVCRINIMGSAHEGGVLVVSARPFNPEGVSFIHDVKVLSSGWLINGKDKIFFSDTSCRNLLSNYAKGDVLSKIGSLNNDKKIKCRVGLCSAAGVFDMGPCEEKDITITVPMRPDEVKRTKGARISVVKWPDATEAVSKLSVPDERFKYLYDASVRNLILMSPGTVYAGPYTYKDFWFRDAAYVLNALLAAGLAERARRIIDSFPALQTPSGYFRSQDGEWDSNGQVLWIMKRYCEMTGQEPDENWRRSIWRAVKWISRKRTSRKGGEKHAGLFPAGFSAEHFGPNDYYYWDNFWGVAGLDAACFLAAGSDAGENTIECLDQKSSFLKAIDESINKVREEQGISTVPSSPYRRMDSSAVGILSAVYPLKIWEASDERIVNTVNYLMENDFVNGLFFHEIAHSGLNVYLSLHIAQVLLMNADPRYFDVAARAAEAASGTGQWPEAVNPVTGGGCMGDGQHSWASAEWIMMIRNFFVREENKVLVLCSGIPEHWLERGEPLGFGPAPTSFGVVDIKIFPGEGTVKIIVEADWRGHIPEVEIRMPGYPVAELVPGQNTVHLTRKSL